jgi:acyl-CoA synthetase (NDP forming)
MDLTPLFEPRTVAVLGVSSSNTRHPANEIFTKNLLRYPVRIYGVNPRGGTFIGQKILKSVAEIPEPVDLAVIAVRAEAVPDLLSQCIEAKARSATVISGGFKETGREDLQERIVAIAREASFPPSWGPTAWGSTSPPAWTPSSCRRNGW